MNITLHISPELFNKLQKHLFDHAEEKEQGAFLFAKLEHEYTALHFSVTGLLELAGDDLHQQDVDYLELSENSWPKVIKQAHSLEACLIEVHSHTGPWDAAFSISDYHGLRETVPHIWWRLKNRPYMALVFTKEGFDALVWTDSPRNPLPLDYISVDGLKIKPTNHSLIYWR
ncbi:MAG: hypothetical protein A2X79_00765 [Desulfuromonadaceae bacterium GWB2_53_15]|nr:MAG: hypothetical protein A2X79_00765 [Desulfuromonadaceae bacterium GWB2_53_15]